VCIALNLVSHANHKIPVRVLTFVLHRLSHQRLPQSAFAQTAFVPNGNINTLAQADNDRSRLIRRQDIFSIRDTTNEGSFI